MMVGDYLAFLSMAIGLFLLMYAVKYYASSVVVLIRNNPRRNNKNGNEAKHDNDADIRASLQTNGGSHESIQERMNGPFRTEAEIRTELHQLREEYRSGVIEPRNYERKMEILQTELDILEGEPLVSIHLPFYNERSVADRILKACNSLDYKNYEVVIVDDSTDDTPTILEAWRDNPHVKIIHREQRSGFKGGALNVALKHMDRRAKYVMVFDADFIPPPDIVHQFLAYFENGFNGNNNSKRNPGNDKAPNGSLSKENFVGISEKLRVWHRNKEVAAVQGYQWHYLNSGENWLTRGVRAEFSASYVVERTSQELAGAMKLIAGSVFMIKTEILRKYGWSTSITEDWELTLRLYADGYKVLYTPHIQVPAECPSTIPRLVRQRMRWAEGHTHNVKKYFWRILRSERLSVREKIEFLYYSPYYLQSFLLLVGTASWILSGLLRGNVPFWNSTLGWSLILLNLLAIPLMCLTGLFMEKSVGKSYGGVLSVIALSHILAPFQGYASLKGLIEKEEKSVWIRTLKTGRITEPLLKLQLRRTIRGIVRRVRKSNARPRVRAALADTGGLFINPIVRIVGHVDERKSASWEPQLSPRYCSLCGRDLVVNSRYCDWCGVRARGAS